MENIILQGITPEQLTERLRGVILETQNEELLTLKEAAKFLTIGYRTLSSYKQQGIVKAHQIGDTVVYRKSDLMNALEELR